MAEMRDKVKGGIDAAADGAKRLTDRASDTSSGMIDSAKQNINEAADKATEMAGQARQKVREWASDAGDNASQAADKVQHWAQDAYHYGEEHLGDFGKEVTTMVRRYPIQALLIGFAVGCVLGRVSRA